MIHDTIKASLAAGTSCGAAVTSFFTDTLPVLQWFGVVIAIIAGLVSISLGIRAWLKK